MTHVVQSVLLKRNHFTLPEAKQWLTKHGYTHHKVDTTPTYFRFRQHDPGHLEALHYRARTIKLGNIGDLIIFYSP
jgi:hypothetical protein